MNEIWKAIPGHEGKYEVSTFGNVRSLTRWYPFRGNFKRSVIGRNLKHCKSGFYLCVTLDGKKVYYIHKLVGMAFLPNHENKTQVNHKDLDKYNNHVDNLEWVTPAENALHARKTGAMPHVTARVLSDDQIIEIYKSSGSYKDISQKTGIDPNHVYRIKTGRTWSHLTNHPKFYA